MSTDEDRLGQICEELADCCAEQGWTKSPSVQEAVHPPAVVVVVPDGDFIDYESASMGGEDAEYTLYVTLLVSATDKVHAKSQLGPHLTPTSELITAINELNFADGGTAEVIRARDFGTYSVGKATLYGVTLVVRANA